MTVQYINELEKCLVRERFSYLVQLIIEDEDRISFQALSGPDFDRAPEHIRALLALNAVPVKKREALIEFAGENGGDVEFFKRVYQAFPEHPTAGEAALINAIAAGDSENILKLILVDHVKLENFVSEFLTLLPNLSHTAVVALFQKGMTCQLQVKILNILLNEVMEPRILTSMDRLDLLKYCNAMIHIFQGDLGLEYPERISADWFPYVKNFENWFANCPFHYIFDPHHWYTLVFRTDGGVKAEETEDWIVFSADGEKDTGDPEGE